MKIRESLVIVALSAVIAVSAMAAGPKVRSDYDHSANFSAYKTFAFVSPPGTEVDGYPADITQGIKSAVQREMEKRGYRLADSHSDLLVNFSAGLAKKARHDELAKQTSATTAIARESRCRCTRPGRRTPMTRARRITSKARSTSTSWTRPPRSWFGRASPSARSGNWIGLSRRCSPGSIAPSPTFSPSIRFGRATERVAAPVPRIPSTKDSSACNCRWVVAVIGGDSSAHKRARSGLTLIRREANRPREFRSSAPKARTDRFDADSIDADSIDAD